VCAVRCLVLSGFYQTVAPGVGRDAEPRAFFTLRLLLLGKITLRNRWRAWSVPAPLRPPRSVLTPGPGPCLMRHGSWSWSCRPRQHPGVGGRCHTFDVHGLPNAEKRDTRRRGWGRVSKGAGGAEAVGSRTAYAWALAHDEMESREVHPK